MQHPLHAPSSSPSGIRGPDPRLCRGVSPATPVLHQKVIFSFLTPQQSPSPTQQSVSSPGGQETGQGLRSRTGGIFKNLKSWVRSPEDTIEARVGPRSRPFSGRSGPRPSPTRQEPGGVNKPRGTHRDWRAKDGGVSPAEPTGSTKGCRSALSFQFNGDACVSVCDIYISRANVSAANES